MTVIGLPDTVALAAVALIGYLFGNRTHKMIARVLANRRQRELERAARIAWQLETIADSLRQDLASHHSQIAGFKRRLKLAQEEGNDQSWDLLCNEAESILGPTMQLAQQLAHAYDEIRQQSEALEAFTKGRTDPLTGVGNSRALDQQIAVFLKAAERGGGEFAVALVSMDRLSPSPEQPNVPGHREAIETMPKLAGIIRTCMRDSDFVARYGDEEFVVVMPKTSLAGACVFGDRVRKTVQEELSITVSCGMAEYQAGDESKTLLGRADSAFYSAKAAGNNHQFVHTGTNIREHISKSSSASKSPLPVDESDIMDSISAVQNAVAAAAGEPESSGGKQDKADVGSEDNGRCVPNPIA